MRHLIRNLIPSSLHPGRIADKLLRRLLHVKGPPTAWGVPRIALAIDTEGGDRTGKKFLTTVDYFAGLKSCDFFLSPPGWRMPVSHNLIEAMMCGAVPILNHPESLDPPLRHGVNCLAFTDLEGFKAQIRAALEMSPDQIERMRREVSGYYDRFLASSTFGMALSASISDGLLVNAEEKSVPLMYPQFVWSPKSY